MVNAPDDLNQAVKGTSRYRTTTLPLVCPDDSVDDRSTAQAYADSEPLRDTPRGRKATGQGVRRLMHTDGLAGAPGGTATRSQRLPLSSLTITVSPYPSSPQVRGRGAGLCHRSGARGGNPTLAGLPQLVVIGVVGTGCWRRCAGYAGSRYRGADSGAPCSSPATEALALADGGNPGVGDLVVHAPYRCPGADCYARAIMIVSIGTWLVTRRSSNVIPAAADRKASAADGRCRMSASVASVRAASLTAVASLGVRR